MTWPTSKIDLIAQACAITGNNVPVTADDGSDEWTVCSAAYEMALEYMLDNADWKQLTTVAKLTSTGVAPADDQFDTAYAKPPDCVHVIWVRLNDLPVVYQILNNQIVVNQFGNSPGAGAPVGAAGLTATLKYVSSGPPSALAAVGGVVPPGPGAAAQMLRTFMTALTTFVMAGIYRGLHGEYDEAARMTKQAYGLLAEARSRSDQEQPKRSMFNSRITMSRRVRRPFPVTPSGWGGTGSPG